MRRVICLQRCTQCLRAGIGFDYCAITVEGRTLECRGVIQSILDARVIGFVLAVCSVLLMFESTMVAAVILPRFFVTSDAAASAASLLAVS